MLWLNWGSLPNVLAENFNQQQKILYSYTHTILVQLLSDHSQQVLENKISANPRRLSAHRISSTLQCREMTSHSKQIQHVEIYQ